MDPLLWDAIQSLRSSRKQQSVNNNSLYDASVTDSNQYSYPEFSEYTVVQPQISATGSEEWEGPSSASYDSYNQEPEAEDPDGEPLIIEDEDPELARKRKELREIEERIKRKKVSIALKTVEHIVKNVTEVPSTNGELDECEGPTLKERVHAILQNHHPNSFLSKARMHPKGILKSSSQSKLHGDHPLKLRVKKLLKQRHEDPFVFSTYGQTPDITPPPPTQRETSAEKEASSSDLGFQRFLNILNKGVDMDMLSKIVNAEGEDLLVEDKSEPLSSKRQEEERPLRSESQESSSGASLPRRGCTSSGERQTSLHSPERSLSERFSLPKDEEKRHDRGDRCLLSSEASLPSHSPSSSTERKIILHSQERSLGQNLSLPKDEVKNNQADRCFASSSRSRSPPALKKKKKEESPKVDDHREQLQNILQTLGLSLEVEEMSKLTDRTQERLYGKKRTESREEQESQQRDPHKRHRNSSSSSSSRSSSCSSSSSSSGSESQSSSPSPSRRQLSRSRDSKERRKSKRSRSKDRLRDERLSHDSKQDDKNTLSYRGRDGEHAKDTFTHENPDSHQPVPTYSAHHTAGFPAYTDYDFPQYSQYENYQNTLNSATDSYWMNPQDAYPASFYPNEYHCDKRHRFSNRSTVLKTVSRLPEQPERSFFVNPDLCQSEGQDAWACPSRCLLVVSTRQTASQSRAKAPARDRDTRNPGCKKKKKNNNKKKKKMAQIMERDMMMVKEAEEREKEAWRMEQAKKEEALRVDKEDSKTEQSEEEKPAPTEEEIKKNLRKMLAAFNRKPKPNVIQPPNFISCETE